MYLSFPYWPTVEQVYMLAMCAAAFVGFAVGRGTSD
jgi:hypothetical protein